MKNLGDVLAHFLQCCRYYSSDIDLNILFLFYFIYSGYANTRLFLLSFLFIFTLTASLERPPTAAEDVKGGARGLGEREPAPSTGPGGFSQPSTFN